MCDRKAAIGWACSENTLSEESRAVCWERSGSSVIEVRSSGSGRDHGGCARPATESSDGLKRLAESPGG